MTNLQKLIITAALAIGITLQHWPAKAGTEPEGVQIDSYMACMVGRFSISLNVDHSDKGLGEAIKYAFESCAKLDMLKKLAPTVQENIKAQIIAMQQAMYTGLKQAKAEPMADKEDANNEAKNKL